ncbi:hypothetical protein QA601_16280 [Chitinispirillales bacterium ANBcel5]|uniref:hypothetical protein n=1 Tax=Cellulosispirillum alkaliphilum TaxID=3039283 RepID=UPI002A530A84|nr:hypothetical protein [Chitinispirillales bacterium ANBcel5]
MICPACGHVVHLSWGWCPYHATRGMRFEGLYTGNDENERFIKHFDTHFDNAEIGVAYRADKQKGKQDQRTFVHWTEFEVRKNRKD